MSFHTLKISVFVSITAILSSLSGCGGSSAPSQALDSTATQSVTLALDVSDTAAVPAVEALPVFHVAPVLLDEPADVDPANPNTPAELVPHTQDVPASMSYLSTRRLSLQTLRAAASNRMVIQSFTPDEVATPMVTGTQVTTYSPAQIRAAYGLPPLPTGTSTPSTLQAAQMGAGQTIYIVDSYNDPNVAAELAAFNQKFALPACTTTTIAPTTKLPLAAASTTSCTLSIVYSTSTGAMTSTVPAYDSGWQTEIALDVEWAHATAPLARIILIEAPDAQLNSLLGAVALANKMGPGVVSMSFGANEGTWTSSVDANFAAANMTYLAAAGDSGAAVDWPAVSPYVVAVGGTSLSYTAGLARSEVVWSGTGGSISKYTATPSYQTVAVPGMLAYGHRVVSDVAFNADPATGQYVNVINPGSATSSWLSAGGTSLSTPQWAGIIAIANALRAQSSKTALGQPHSVLYGQIAATRTTYASAFADVTSGTNGTCSTCIAKIGYDTPTGLGTPNTTQLLASLSGTTINSAPVVASASISGTTGAPLSFSVSVTATHAVTYSISNAPSGLTINTSGIVSWASPLAGTYAITVTALDTTTGLSGSAVYTLTIAAPLPPIITGATIRGTAGTSLSFAITATSTHALSYALTGAPSGMTVNTSGIVAWASPITGTYAVTAKATDITTGLNGSAVYTVTIAAPTPPTVTSANINGTAGSALSFSVSVSSPNPVSFALSSAPSGMSISTSGVVSWSSPIAGTYAVKVTATDTKTGLAGNGTYTITIAPAGPVIKTTPMVGVAGKPLSGTITISDATSTSVSITISGIPMGMTFSVSGSVITASWAKPVTGNYTLQIQARDANGKTASATLPVTVSAQ